MARIRIIATLPVVLPEPNPARRGLPPNCRKRDSGATSPRQRETRTGMPHPIASHQSLDALTWRCIGPLRGGRVVAVAGDPVEPQTFYFGACAGGVWKTDRRRHLLAQRLRRLLHPSAVGAIAVAPSDPNVIYAGTGETRSASTSPTATASTRPPMPAAPGTMSACARRAHRQDRDPPHEPGHRLRRGARPRVRPERGTRRVPHERRRQDLGARCSSSTPTPAAVDISLDPNNPRILFAAFWQTRRNFWNISSGGPGQRAVPLAPTAATPGRKSPARPACPKGLLGKIGVAVSPARRGRVWALIEA